MTEYVFFPSACWAGSPLDRPRFFHILALSADLQDSGEVVDVGHFIFLLNMD